MLKFISGLRVHLCWGGVKTELMERGNVGAPQGSLEGMWNFGVYADNIHSAIASTVPGFNLGHDLVKDVIYADDITLINPLSSETNLALEAVHKAGKFDAFKFKAQKCKIIGVDATDPTVFRLGSEIVEGPLRGYC